MASSELSIDEILNYFIENGGKVSNRDLVKHFKKYLTHQDSKDDARLKFKKYINTLASSRTDGEEKYLVLKSKYLPDGKSSNAAVPVLLPQNTLGIPSPDVSQDSISSPVQRTRLPPPYRPPPPVSSPTSSLDNISISSTSTAIVEEPPQAPPRRRIVEKARPSPPELEEQKESGEQAISVKERTQKFNRLASVDNDLSPQPQKEKKAQLNKGVDEDDGASVTPLGRQRTEWVVAAARRDYQVLAKLAAMNPRLAKTRDQFTGYTALHWAAKFGNLDIIKLVAGTYNGDPNARTNGGYTPLHIAMQFDRKEVYDLLVKVYGADTELRDWSGRKASHYRDIKTNNANSKADTNRNLKTRKKASEKDLGFLRIGSLNVRVKKTTEAFSNFLGVGSSGTVTPVDSGIEKAQKSWGSADNISKGTEMLAPKIIPPNKRKMKYEDIILSHSTPGSPNQKRSIAIQQLPNDSDSDTACGFDSNWKN